MSLRRATLSVVIALPVALTACPKDSSSDCGSAEPNIAPACEGGAQEGPPPFSPYPTHSDIVASVFWVGEGATPESGNIPNFASAWDPEWQTHYGGVDAPEGRNKACPCFAPKENPYYVALPYNDLIEKGDRRPDSEVVIPWYSVVFPTVEEAESVLKDRWVEVSVGNKRCYGQWEDVGPALEDDADYVFGTARPKNTFGVGAGIDLSPALAACLGIPLNGSGKVNWRFMDTAFVPKGPWTTVVTLPR